MSRIKLDKLDKKILRALSDNSRQSLSSIARQARTSKQVADYRIKNLVKSGVVCKFFTLVDWQALGFSSFRLYVQLENITPREQASMVKRLQEFEKVYFVGVCEGRVDLIIRFLARNAAEFKESMDAFFEEFGAYVRDKEVTMVTRDPFLFTTPARCLFGGAKKLQKPVAGEELKIDEKDCRILAVLCENARAPSSEIARKTGLSPDVVAYRIKQLAKSGVIRGFSCYIDSKKLEFEHYKMFLRFGRVNKKKKGEFFNFYAEHPNAVFLLECAGSWDAELDFDVKNIEHFHELALELKRNFGEMIRSYETAAFLEEHYPNPFKHISFKE